MNGPSLKKFEDEVVPGGTVFLNSSIIKEKVDREDLRVIQVPCDTIANELGNGKVANMVMLGRLYRRHRRPEGGYSAGDDPADVHWA